MGHDPGEELEVNMRERRRPGPRIMERFNWKPFAHNGSGRDGFDCMGLITAYLRELEYDLPQSFQGITLENYTDFYLGDRQAAHAILLEFMDHYGEAVDVGSQIAGDLIVVKNDQDLLFPAIYAGNGNIMMVAQDVGVRVIALGKRRTIVKVRRP